MSKDNHVILTARLNRNREEERQVIEIIEYWKSHDVNFKQLIVDRILRGENIDPITFAREEFPPKRPVTLDELRDVLSELPRPETITLEDVRKMLEEFAADLMRQLKRRADLPRVQDDDDEDTDSAFARNFARGFLQRQNRAGKDNDDE